ncbi:MAG: MFS transporter [Burkholderiaceae bacterium]
MSATSARPPRRDALSRGRRPPTDAGPVPADAPLSRSGEALATAVLLTGTFMVVLDFFIINVALPTMQRQLGATDTQTQWFVVAYGLAYACTLVAGGRLGELYGHRQCFRAGMLTFLLASAACGVAQGPGVLCAARALQGLGAALVSPQVLVLLGRLLPAARQARAFSWYGLVLGVASTGGQILGGLLLAYAGADWGWRACFLVNVPICAAALALSKRALPAEPRRPRGEADVAGMVLVCIGMLLLIGPIVEGRDAHWPAWTWLSLAGAALAFAGFARRQQRLARQGRPGMMPPALLAHRGFLIGLAATLAFYVGNASHYFVLALYLQRGLGLDPLRAGSVFACLAVGFMATTLSASRLKRRFGDRTLAGGAAVLAAGHLALWVVLSTVLPAAGGPVAAPAMAALCAALVVEGLGIGIVMAPLVATVVALLPPRHAGVGSGLMTTTHQAGNALGVALIGLVFFSAGGSGPDLDATRALRASLVALTASSALAGWLLWRLGSQRPITEPDLTPG